MAWNLVTQHYFRTPLVGFTSRIHLIGRLSNIESFQMNSGLCKNSQRRMTTMRVFIRVRDWGRGSPKNSNFLNLFRKYTENMPWIPLLWQTLISLGPPSPCEKNFWFRAWVTIYATWYNVCCICLCTCMYTYVYISLLCFYKYIFIDFWGGCCLLIKWFNYRNKKLF